MPYLISNQSRIMPQSTVSKATLSFFYSFNLREKEKQSPDYSYKQGFHTLKTHVKLKSKRLWQSVYQLLWMFSDVCWCVGVWTLVCFHCKLCNSKVWVWRTFLSQSLLLRPLWLLCSTLTSSHLSIKVSSSVMPFTLHFPFTLLNLLLCLCAHSLQLSCCYVSCKQVTNMSTP